MSRPTVVFFMGPPGAGKGTQAAAVAQQRGATVVSTSQVLTEMFAAHAPGAEKIKLALDRGVLAPPALFADALLRVVGRALGAGNVVFIDGSPRTLREAEMLIGALKSQGVSWQTMILDVPKPIAVQRVLQRWVCERCWAAISLADAPTSCAKCGDPMRRRPDDTADTIERRWSEFTFRTAPVLEWMKGRGDVVVVDGNRPISEVTADVTAKLRSALAA